MDWTREFQKSRTGNGYDCRDKSPSDSEVNMKWFLVFLLPAVLLVAFYLSAQTNDISAVVASYDRAFRSKDVETIRKLLADDIVIYEHSVQNMGIAEAFEKHLRPEIQAFENIQAEFTGMKITPGSDMALVTRQYKIQGRVRGKDTTAAGNETMVWKNVGGQWKLAHIHYSHPCPQSG